jgi:hypothetical protein
MVRERYAAVAACLLVIGVLACRGRTVEKTATSVAPNVATTESVGEAEGDDAPTGEPTVMPDVANKDVVDATRELQARGLEVDITFVSDDRVSLGLTTPTDDHPGDTVHKGESVILGVSVRDPAKAGHFALSEADRVRLSDATAAKLREIVAANK